MSAQADMVAEGLHVPYKLVINTKVWDVLPGEEEDQTQYMLKHRAGVAMVMVEELQTRITYDQLPTYLLSGVSAAGVQNPKVVDYFVWELSGNWYLVFMVEAKLEDGREIKAVVYTHASEYGTLSLTFVAPREEFSLYTTDFDNVLLAIQFLEKERVTEDEEVMDEASVIEEDATPEELPNVEEEAPLEG